MGLIGGYIWSYVLKILPNTKNQSYYEIKTNLTLTEYLIHTFALLHLLLATAYEFK